SYSSGERSFSRKITRAGFWEIIVPMRVRKSSGQALRWVTQMSLLPSSRLHIDVVGHHRLKALIFDSLVNLVVTSAVGDFKLLVAFAIAAMVADTGGNTGGNLRGGNVDNIIPEPSALT